MSASFADDVAAFADAGFAAMEVWFTKLEKHLEKHTVSETKSLLGDRNLQLAAAAYQGGLLITTGEQRLVHYEQFKRRLELCREFAIPTVVVAADFIDRIDATTLDLAMSSLAQAGEMAGAHQVRLAVEFQSTAQWCRGLDTAIAFVCSTESPHVGVNLDLFHYYTGPSKSEDLKALTPRNLAHVQVCDLAALTRELATDSDRILPGDGDIPLASISATLRSAGYGGWVSVELFNPELWKLPPIRVAESCRAALERVLQPARK
jgi:4-hydroxyphenylpyruvate dioxygenase